MPGSILMMAQLIVVEPSLLLREWLAEVDRDELELSPVEHNYLEMTNRKLTNYYLIRHADSLNRIEKILTPLLSNSIV